MQPLPGETDCVAHRYGLDHGIPRKNTIQQCCRDHPQQIHQYHDHQRRQNRSGERLRRQERGAVCLARGFAKVFRVFLVQAKHGRGCWWVRATMVGEFSPWRDVMNSRQIR